MKVTVVNLGVDVSTSAKLCFLCYLSYLYYTILLCSVDVDWVSLTTKNSNQE